MVVEQSLERVFKQLLKCNAGRTIAEMKVYLTAWPNTQSMARLTEMEREYDAMQDAWRQGLEDASLEENYHSLMDRLYVLVSNIAVYRRIQMSSFLKLLYDGARKEGHDWSVDAIRTEMESFVSDVAMLGLEPEEGRKAKSARIYKDHQTHMTQLFNYVVTSRMWSTKVGQGFTKLLLSPTIDSIDQQLLIAAIMISAMMHFDIVKFRLLTEVYRKATDEHVRQRALVGWVMAIDDNATLVYPEIRETIVRMAGDESIVKELTELQIQLIYTTNAERDRDTFTQEIMPGIMRNSGFRVTKTGIEEVNDDPLEDILHPDAAERREEEMESIVKRMADMQEKGSDVYFGEFAQMKRFPFFYDAANWLTPFYINHPDIAQFVEKDTIGFLTPKMMAKWPFCSSDKYSLIVASPHIFGMIPENIRQMFANNEAGIMGMEAPEETPFSIRRMWLMDMYRFFRLFPNRSAFTNPFDDKTKDSERLAFFSSIVFIGTPLDDKKADVAETMIRFKQEKWSKRVLNSVPKEKRDARYYMLCKEYGMAYKLAPDNETVLRAFARQSFNMKLYEIAAQSYEQLMMMQPDKVGYKLNRAVCLVKMEDYEEALRILYEIGYEHPDDRNIQRALAWALCCDGKTAQAATLYDQLLGEDSPTAEDYLNAGLCQWVMGHNDEAIRLLRRYVALKPDDEPIDLDMHWLEQHDINPIAIHMMLAAIQE